MKVGDNYFAGAQTITDEVSTIEFENPVCELTLLNGKGSTLEVCFGTDEMKPSKIFQLRETEAITINLLVHRFSCRAIKESADLRWLGIVRYPKRS